MADPFLIAHKVRGEPAFDVAIQMDCPHCREFDYVEGVAVSEVSIGCHECDSLGYWWIIPTSGHRAYPWHWAQIADTEILDTMPAGLVDHYVTKSTPKVSLVDALNLRKPSLTIRPSTPIARRF